jgi:hypothetical protein
MGEHKDVSGQPVDPHPTGSAPPLSISAVQKDDYGQYFHEHALEQYKLYVEMADRVSQRRQTANTFFLTLNTALIGLLGLNWPASWCAPRSWPVVVSIAGVTISVAWSALIRSYSKLNSAKFEVVGLIESLLPVSPYSTEWTIAGKGKVPRLYRPLSHIEGAVPWVFVAMYAMIGAYTIVRMVSCGYLQLLAFWR